MDFEVVELLSEYFGIHMARNVKETSCNEIWDLSLRFQCTFMVSLVELYSHKLTSRQRVIGKWLQEITEFVAHVFFTVALQNYHADSSPQASIYLTIHLCDFLTH